MVTSIGVQDATQSYSNPTSTMKMSKMSTAHLSIKQRQKIIRDHIATHTYDEIAQLCGVTKKTIYRDVLSWKEQGGFKEFLLHEFFRLYGIVKVKNVDHAFDRVCDLLRRQGDVGLAESVDEIVLKWQENETDST